MTAYPGLAQDALQLYTHGNSRCQKVKKVRGVYSSLWGNPTTELRDVTYCKGSPANERARDTALTTAKQASTRFTYPRGMEG